MWIASLISLRHMYSITPSSPTLTALGRYSFLSLHCHATPPGVLVFSSLPENGYIGYHEQTLPSLQHIPVSSTQRHTHFLKTFSVHWVQTVKISIRCCSSGNCIPCIITCVSFQQMEINMNKGVMLLVPYLLMLPAFSVSSVQPIWQFLPTIINWSPCNLTPSISQISTNKISSPNPHKSSLA